LFIRWQLILVEVVTTLPLHHRAKVGLQWQAKIARCGAAGPAGPVLAKPLSWQNNLFIEVAQ
jgi:hypothetical protein